MDATSSHQFRNDRNIIHKLVERSDVFDEQRQGDYNGSSENVGTTTGATVFNAVSSNLGTVKNIAVFNASSTNAGIVSGGATFYGDASNDTGTVAGIKTRYYNSPATTTRNFVGWTVVADGVLVNVASSTHDVTTVFRTLNGGAFIGGPTTVYWKSNADNNWGTVFNWYADASTTVPLDSVATSTDTVVILGTTTPIVDLTANTWQTPSGIDASRTGIIFTASTTEHIATSVTGSTTLSGFVINDNIISGNATFVGTSSNSSAGVVSGTAYFYGASYNNGGSLDGDAVFDDDSYNTNGGTIVGDATFNGDSYNDTSAGTISGAAAFNDSSHNAGTIVNDAVFYGDSTENTGTVEGTQTRYYSANATTSRDFVTTGPWTLVADGAVVDFSDSAIISATSTILTTKNGGSFTGGGLPGPTDCSNPLEFPGTYTLSASTTNVCNITTSGVIWTVMGIRSVLLSLLLRHIHIFVQSAQGTLVIL